MNVNAPTEVDWLFFLVATAVVVASLHEAWQNLLHRRFSRFGLYGIVAQIGLKLGNKRTVERIRKASTDRGGMLWAGLQALAVGMGFLVFLVIWIRKFTSP